MTNILHLPIGDYLEFNIGGTGPGYQSFQGFVTGVSIRLGPGALLKDLDILTSEINMYYNYEMSTTIYNQK